MDYLSLFSGAGGGDLAMHKDIAYMAGFFDGEGSISLAVRKHPKKKTIVGIYLQVSNKHKEPLDLYQSYFGGYIYVVLQSGRPFYKWALKGRVAVEHFLNSVGSLLICKKIQVKLAYEACKIQEARGIGRRVGYSENQLQRLREIKSGISKANDRFKRCDT